LAFHAEKTEQNKLRDISASTAKIGGANNGNAIHLSVTFQLGESCNERKYISWNPTMTVYRSFFVDVEPKEDEAIVIEGRNIITLVQAIRNIRRQGFEG